MIISKIPTPVLVWLAAFVAATASWLLTSWISLLSGQVLIPELRFGSMTIASIIAGIAAGVSRDA